MSGEYNPAEAPIPTNAGKIKEPLVAAILSFIIAGSGQMYNGQLKKGLCFFGLDIILIFAFVFIFMAGIFVTGLASIMVGGVGLCCCIPAFIIPVIWRLYFARDAYQDAEMINRGIVVQDWFA